MGKIDSKKPAPAWSASGRGSYDSNILNVTFVSLFLSFIRPSGAAGLESLQLQRTVLGRRVR
jgi:hypothetical protein